MQRQKPVLFHFESSGGLLRSRVHYELLEKIVGAKKQRNKLVIR